jgi:hypothetical protein
MNVIILSSMISVDSSSYVYGRYDGNKTIGHRLYREVNMCQSRRNSKSKQCLSPTTISSRWETLATNLEEFHKVAVRFNFLFVLEWEP